jgi:hypothetical protein
MRSLRAFSKKTECPVVVTKRASIAIRSSAAAAFTGRTARAVMALVGVAVTTTVASSRADEPRPGGAPIVIGDRLELFVDDRLVDATKGVAFHMHEPVRQPPARSPLPRGSYGTIIKDGEVYRAYYRSEIPGYDGQREEGHPGEITCCAESRDGIEWTFPDWGITDVRSPQGNNVILTGQSPFSHNFSPFLDARPGVEPASRYKALAGGHKSGLHAFRSADGLKWTKVQETPVMKTPAASIAPFGPWAFDSQNVAFWSEAEQCYVCFVRTWSQDVRGISRSTSPDFVHWSPPVDTKANGPNENLYTSQTHPYYRAPHIYIATPMRFVQGLLMGEPVEGNNGSSDILLMSMRAGAASYHRAFREAFIRPGLDPRRWERKANSAWRNVVPTGPAEMSIYHVSGDRYTLRTDGFISLRAGVVDGEFLTKPLVFSGAALSVNFSTGAAGGMRIEIQDAAGQIIPGFGLEECVPLVGDAIERCVQWKSGPQLGTLAGRPVRLRFEMRECDLYAIRFGTP